VDLEAYMLILQWTEYKTNEEILQIVETKSNNGHH